MSTASITFASYLFSFILDTHCLKAPQNVTCYIPSIMSLNIYSIIHQTSKQICTIKMITKLIDQVQESPAVDHREEEQDANCFPGLECNLPPTSEVSEGSAEQTNNGGVSCLCLISGIKEQTARCCPTAERGQYEECKNSILVSL